MAGQVTFTIYPVVNYSFGTKAAKQDKDATPQDRLARMEEQYRRLGQRRTVDAVLLVGDGAVGNTGSNVYGVVYMALCVHEHTCMALCFVVLYI